MIVKKRAKQRCFYDLNDRRATILDPVQLSQAEIENRYKCPGRGCPNLSPQWHKDPESIDVVVDRTKQAWVHGIGVIALTALDNDLLDVLEPYCREMLFGNVLLDSGGERPEPTRFTTITAPQQARIQSDRGQYCRHSYWTCCGVFRNSIGWAGGAIVERTLDDRLVYVDQDGNILVADELVSSLDLKKRFPKLWLEAIPVVPQPLDEEVLPGDLGWDGTLRRKYNASLGVVVSVPYTPNRTRGKEIYREFLQRLNRELVLVGAEDAFKDGGSHGSCFFYARGLSTDSLKEAVLRVLKEWRVRARFSMTLTPFEITVGAAQREQIELDGETGEQRSELIYPPCYPQVSSADSGVEHD